MSNDAALTTPGGGFRTSGMICCSDQVSGVRESMFEVAGENQLLLSGLDTEMIPSPTVWLTPVQWGWGDLSLLFLAPRG